MSALAAPPATRKDMHGKGEQGVDAWLSLNGSARSGPPAIATPPSGVPIPLGRAPARDSERIS